MLAKSALATWKLDYTRKTGGEFGFWDAVKFVCTGVGAAIILGGPEELSGQGGNETGAPREFLEPGGRGYGKPEVPWSSSTVRRAAKELSNGAKRAYVPSREEAEELFLRLFQGQQPPYRNSTGMDSTEARRFFDGRARTYHWDDQVGSDGRLLKHPEGDVNAQYRHLQIHTDRDVIVISYGEP